MGPITVWETFFMFLVIPPISKAMSSVFMSLVVRAGTIDEERLAFGGMASMAALGGAVYKTALGGSKNINKAASNAAKNVKQDNGDQGGGLANKRAGLAGTTAGMDAGMGAGMAGSRGVGTFAADMGGYEGGDRETARIVSDALGTDTSDPNTGLGGAGVSGAGIADSDAGSAGSPGLGLSSMGESGGEEYVSGDMYGAGASGASSGSPYGDYEGGYRMTPIPPLKQREDRESTPKQQEPPPLPIDEITDRTNEQSSKIAGGMAFAGAFAPVAGPAVAAVLGVTGKMTAGTALQTGRIIKNVGKNTIESMKKGERFTSAMGNSVKTLTGAGSVSEANARIIGSILGSSLGASTSKWAGNAAGKGAVLAGRGAAKIINKYRN